MTNENMGEEEIINKELLEIRGRIKANLKRTLDFPEGYFDGLDTALDEVRKYRSILCNLGNPLMIQLAADAYAAVGRISLEYILQFREYYNKTRDMRAAIFASDTLEVLLEENPAFALEMGALGLSREEQEQIKKEGLRCQLWGAP